MAQLLKLSTRKIFTQSNSPRKFILIYLEDKSQVSLALSKRLQAQFKSVHLNILETDRLIESPQVPFTVIITKQTLSDGILQLQHFMPKIREQIHVSDLTTRLVPDNK